MAQRIGKRRNALKLVFSLSVVVLGSIAFLLGCSSFGGDVSGERLAKVEVSDQYKDGQFINTVPQGKAGIGVYWNYIVEQFFGDEIRIPPNPIPVIPIDLKTIKQKPEPGLRAIWLGHASVYLEIDGYRIMVDPVLSEYASPISGIGPKRFHPSPIALEDLPKIDAVMISHDHYDHLDMKTVQHLALMGTRFYVPLGVGTHFDTWNIPQEQVFELDWWQEVRLEGLKIVSTPARHYSGRELFDYKETFWSSWTVIGPENRIFYSGDTGYSDHFKKIGKKFGPFDLGIIKIGAYGPGDAWIDIHMDPENAVKSSADVQAKKMFPVHWATFNMAFHHWDEPIKRAIFAAKKENVDLVTPRVGEVVFAHEKFKPNKWWEDLK